ncbi:MULTISPECIES: UTRA domain-containing protein [unclassified Nonomuraea]|uniref:GntR family transcriptional regulator n=1 Tax=unclassified Nonomuraea TaxID=2593643 RepID=UPI0033F65E96
MEDAGWVSVSAPYVRPRRPGEPDAWAEEAAQHGKVGTHRLQAVEEVHPPKEVVRAFGLAAGQTAFVRRRLVLADGQPTELADSYYPATIARGTRLAEMRKIPGGAPTLLAQLGYHPHSAEEAVQARPATDTERQALDLRPEDWVLLLTRIVRTDDGTPIEVSVMTMVAHGRELRYQMIIK